MDASWGQGRVVTRGREVGGVVLGQAGEVEVEVLSRWASAMFRPVIRLEPAGLKIVWTGNVDRLSWCSRREGGGLAGAGTHIVWMSLEG